MHDPWDPDRGRRRRRRRRPRDHRPQTEPTQRRQRQMTREERAYRDARRRANAKIGFVIHASVYLSVVLFLMIVAGGAARFVAAAWGICLTMHFVSALVAPNLRQRWIEQEVRREIRTTVSDERLRLEGRHARSLEELSASIAHEIRNPITAAKSLVQQMGEDPSAGQNLEYAQVALQELDRVERSISHLLRFARDEEIELRSMRMIDVIDSALETFQDRMAELGVTVKREVDCDGNMEGDPEKLRRVVINLFANALDALVESRTPHPSIELSAGENLAGSEVWVRIRDNGPGIDPDRLEKIFSPFYTSRTSGTGLGLAISKKVVDAHGGSIEAQSSVGAGTEFVLTFPKHPEARGPAA